MLLCVTPAYDREVEPPSQSLSSSSRSQYSPASQCIHTPGQEANWWFRLDLTSLLIPSIWPPLFMGHLFISLPNIFILLFSYPFVVQRATSNQNQRAALTPLEKIILRERPPATSDPHNTTTKTNNQRKRDTTHHPPTQLSTTLLLCRC